MENNKEIPKMPFKWALFCILFLLVSMVCSLLWLDIPVHINLLISIAVTLLVSWLNNGHDWSLLSDAIDYGGKICIQPTIIMMLIGVMIADAIVVRYEPEPDKDFIIILGCGIRKDGTPSPLLRGRIDRALAFADKQKALTGKEAIFVPSGGQGPDEPVSESAAMTRYLLEQGVPPSRILEEDRSTDTHENMRFSKEKIRAVRPDGKIAFATTNYHVFRGGLCARRVKMRAVGMGAKTKWYFWPNAAVREFVGLLTEHRLKQGLILGGMLVFYVALTLLAYR